MNKNDNLDELISENPYVLLDEIPMYNSKIAESEDDYEKDEVNDIGTIINESFWDTEDRHFVRIM